MPEEKKKLRASLEHSSLLEDNSRNGYSRDVKEWVEMNPVGRKDASKKQADKHKQKAGTGQEFPAITDYHVNRTFLMNSNDNNYDSHHKRYNSSDHLSQDSMFDYEIDDSGPHHEMAVDVPDSFVANVKSAPRYPLTWSVDGKSKGVPSKTNSKVKGGEKPNSLPPLPDNNSKQHQQQPTPLELERLHRHQEALKKRREEERKLQAEEEFLRTSLRQSKKLRALESNQPVSLSSSGLINTAFDDEDGSIAGIDNKSHLNRMSDPMIVEPYLKNNVGVDDLFSCLHHIRSCMTSPEEQEQKYISFVRLLFQNEQFQQAVTLHSQMVELTARSPPAKPLTDGAEELYTEVQHYVAPSTHSSHAQELLELLNKLNCKGLIRAHDIVAQQVLKSTKDLDLQEELLDYSLVQYGEDTVKIIHLEKTNEHLGATVKNEGEAVIIGRIVKGGVAEKSGLLHEGDEILEVNGVDIRGRNINDVSEMLANMSGTITFVIIPGLQPSVNISKSSNKVMHLRALFSYDPEDDSYIPCRELGISFLKGDILHAIALDDPNWWQAFRDGEEDHTLAGLIPSKAFAEQLEALKISLENKENKRKHRICACGKKDHKDKRKKKFLNSGSSKDCEQILSYEEITRYYPQPNRKRPIVMVGPSNIGCNELQQKLVASDPDRFSTPVPHTTCPTRSKELQDGAFSHISSEEFNLMVQQNKFVEYGYHNKFMYGTSYDAVRDVIAQGLICLLKIQPETLTVIRASDLIPYIIFVCPPNLEKLWRLQDQLKAPVVNGVRKGKEVLTIDDQLRDIIDHSREIEELYGHLFDFVLVNSDLDQTYRELLSEINRIEVEPQWVPAVCVNVK